MSKVSKKISSVFFCLALLGFLTHCGKPRLFGKNMEIHPIVKEFKVNEKLAFKAAKEALISQGYDVAKENSEEGILETHWQPTTSDSHYVIVFNRQDRGTVGAYHQLIVKVKAQGDHSQVEIYSLAKSIISNLKSTGIEEEKILTKIADFTRKQEIQVTNVGIQ